IGGELQRQDEAVRLLVEIAHQQTLEQTTVPDEAQAIDMDELALERRITIGWAVGVGEIGAEDCIVLLRRRTQKQRPRPVELQIEARQNAGVVMIEPFGIAGLAADVAALIED